MYICTVSRGPDRGKRLRLVSGKTFVVGSGDDADLVLTDPKVLHPHCTLELKGDRILLTDKTASAGTYVDDKKIAKALLGAKNSFRIGDSLIALTLPPKSAPAPMDDPLVGKIVGGYAVKDVVGRGGMGTVYHATQLSLRRGVALKVLASKLAKDTAFRDLFINEARAAAQLVHPNVVQVYDGGTEGDLTYFSMEFMGAGTVEDLLQRDGKIPWKKAILQVLEAAHGLEYAEKKHIVHRDIKPDNLMINDDGRVKIADLGLAKRGESDGDEGIIGTPHFIPPEQALGKDVDTRADIYSLGATFFRMITGKTVFDGKTAKEIVLKHIKEPPPLASRRERSIPGVIDAVLAKCLAKKPGNRYRTATELIAALEKICAEHGIKGAVIKKGVGKKVLIPVAVLLVAAAGLIIFLAMRPDPIDEESKRIAREEKEKTAKITEEKRKADAKAKAAALRASVNTEFLVLKVDAGELHDIDQIYGDLAKKNVRLREWTGQANLFEDYAKKYKKDYSDLAEEARKEAKKIRDRLAYLKSTVVDRQNKVAALLKALEKLDADLEAMRLDWIRKRRYGKGHNRSMDAADPEYSEREDPFQTIVEWEWVNPDKANDRWPIDKFSQVTKKLETIRKAWKKKARDVEDAAQRDYDDVLRHVEPNNILVTLENKANVLSAIEKLREVEKNFDEQTGSTPEIAFLVTNAGKHANSLEDKLNRLERDLLRADRNAIMNQLRLIKSLHPKTFNYLMNLNFAKSERDYRELQGSLKTERYQNFVTERIEMLKWMEFLVASWQQSLHTANVSRNKDFNLAIEIPKDPEHGGEMLSGTLAKWANKTRPKDDEFFFKKRGARLAKHHLGDYGMDWVYNDAFHHKGKPRWKTLTPVLEYALGCFCFETYLFEEAAKHFQKLTKDKTYGESAKALVARANLEAEALAEYVELCNALDQTDSPKKLRALRRQLQTFDNRRKGTLFLLDVLPLNQEVRNDFFGENEVRIPKAPPEPLWAER